MVGDDDRGRGRMSAGAALVVALLVQACSAAPLVPSRMLEGGHCEGQGLPGMALVQCEVPGDVWKLRVVEAEAGRIVLVGEARTGDERGWFVAGVDGPIMVEDLTPGPWELFLRSASGETFSAGRFEVPKPGGGFEQEPGFEELGKGW